MRKKRLLALLGSICLIVAMVACAAPAPTPAPPTPTPTPAPTPPEVIEWRFQAAVAPAGSFNYGLVEEWADLVWESTNHQLKINWYPSGSLVPDGDTFTAICSNAIQGHYSLAAYYTGIIPEGDMISEQPGGPLDWYWFQKLWYVWGWEEIWEPLVNAEGAKTICMLFDPSAAPIRSTIPMRHVSDFEGLKLRSGGGFARFANEYLGAKLVDLVGAELYTAAQMGTIDAFDYATGTLDWDWGFHEVAPYIIMPPGCGINRCDIVVNLEAFNALPKDVQAALVDTSRAYSPVFTWKLGEQDRMATQRMIDEWNNEIIFLPADEWVQYQEYAKEFRMGEAKRVSPTLARMFEIYEEHLPDALVPCAD